MAYNGVMPSFDAKNSSFEILEGTEWIEIPFVGSITEAPGTIPTTVRRSLSHVTTVVGAAEPGELTIDLTTYAPSHDVFRIINGLQRAGQSRSWRLNLRENDLGNPAGESARAAIATTGIVTFSGATVAPKAAPYGAGMILKVGSGRYPIFKIKDDDEVTVRPAPDSGVAAGAFTIARPAMRLGPFVGTPALNGFSATEADGLTGSLTVTPQNVLDHWTIIEDYNSNA